MSYLSCIYVRKREIYTRETQYTSTQYIYLLLILVINIKLSCLIYSQHRYNAELKRII